MMLPPPSPSPLPSPATSSPPSHAAALTVSGQLLTLAEGYLVFTTGDAVCIGKDAHIDPQTRLGRAIRVRLDPASHCAVSVQTLSGASPAPGEISAATIPRAYVVVSPRSARTPQNLGANAANRAVTVIFEVTVPDDTPVNDDVYLSTERSNFSPAELKMNRIDARRWSASLPLQSGSALHYQFTRGSYATVERDSSGGVTAPRSITVQGAMRQTDTVARWADTS